MHLQRRSRDMNTFRTHLEGVLKALNKRKRILRNNADQFKTEVEGLKVKKNKILKFSYTYCPNNNSYNRCSHIVEKRKYTEERNKLISEYNIIASKLSKIRVNLIEEKSNLASDVKSFNKETSRLKSEGLRLQRDINKLNDLGVRLEELKDLVVKFEENIQERIDFLSTKVAEVREES